MLISVIRAAKSSSESLVFAIIFTAVFFPVLCPYNSIINQTFFDEKFDLTFIRSHYLMDR